MENVVISFIEKLIEELRDVNWFISEITDYKETIEDGIGLVAKLPDGRTFKRQDNYFIHQIQRGDDWFSGTIIYPITDSKALIISYEC